MSEDFEGARLRWVCVVCGKKRSDLSVMWVQGSQVYCDEHFKPHLDRLISCSSTTQQGT